MADTPNSSSGTVDVAAFVQEAAKAYQASVTDLTSSLPFGGTGQSLANQGSDLERAGQVAMNEATMRAAIKLQADNATQAAMFGFTPGAPTGIKAELSQKIQAEQRDLDQRREMILSKQQTGFFDNPLSWAVNQITLPYDIAAFNTRNAGQEQHLAVLHSLAILNDDQYRTNAAIDTAASTSLLDGMNTLAAAKAFKEKAASANQAAQLGMEGIRIRMAASADMFRTAVVLNDERIKEVQLGFQRQGLENATTHLELAKAHDVREQEAAVRAEVQSNIAQDTNNRATESHKLDMEVRSLHLGSEQDKKVILDKLNERLANVSRVLNLAPMTWQELQVMGSGKQKDFWENAARDPNFQEGRLGYDATSAMQTANTFNLPLNPGINIVRDHLIKAQDQAIAEAGGGITWKSLGPDVQHYKIQEQIIKRVSAELRNIPDGGGLFSPPSLLKVLEIGQGDSSIAQSKIGTALSPLASSTPNYAFKADDVMATAIQLINDKKATPAEMATEIANIYTAVMVDNNDIRQYGRMALKPPTAGVEGFNTTVQMGINFNGRQSINMVSRAAVESALTRLMTRQIMRESIAAGAGDIMR